MIELSFFWCWMAVVVVIFLVFSVKYGGDDTGMSGIILWPVAALITWVGMKVYEQFGGTWSFL